MNYSRAVAAVAAASLALLAMGGPASAAPPEIEHWTEHNEWIEQEVNEDFCPDLEFDVLFVEDASGTARTVERRGEVYWASTLRSESSWTNVENGKTFSSVWQGQDKDQSLTSNADGTLSLEILVVGPTQYYDDDGNKLFKDVGRNFVSVVVDASGEWMPDTFEVDSKGNSGTEGRDFCDDLQEYIG